MNPSNENDLFGIPLTPSGSAYLLRLYNLARVVFIFAILIELIFFGETWLQNKLYARNYGDLDLLTYLSFNIYPIYSFVVSVITLVQIYFFVYFARQCKAAIQQQKTDQFNASFKWLYRNCVCACILFIFVFIARCFFLYGQYYTFQHFRAK